MAKIGILTYSFTKDNYGQVLQYLATQVYLAQRGHEAILVEPNGWRKTWMRRFKGKIINLMHKTKSWLDMNKQMSKPATNDLEDVTILEVDKRKNAIFRQWAEVTERKEKENPRGFEQFREKFFNRAYGTYDDILEGGYKAFCIGSDQTWSSAGWHMMLGWVPKKYKRFSIAPSVGHRQYTNEQIESFKEELNNFDFITVREDNGLDLCRRCGYTSAIKVLDPSFLLTSDAYEPYIDDIGNTNKPYVFIYLLGGEIQPSLKEMVDFCHNNGYDIKYVESQGREENYESIPARVGQWIGLIKNASYVLTNSFHGMAFSVIYRKPFLVFPLVGIMESMNGRIYDLANTLRLNNRIYTGDMYELLRPIDWTFAENCLQRNKSKLDNLLAKIEL